MKHPLILALAAGATLLFAGAAEAGNVQWSIGISLPPVATVISNGPYYAPVPAPIYYPAPVRYVAPAVYESAPVGYGAPPFHYRGQRPFYGDRGPVGRGEVVFRDRDGRNAGWVPSRYDRDARHDRDQRGDRRWHRD